MDPINTTTPQPQVSTVKQSNWQNITLGAIGVIFVGVICFFIGHALAPQLPSYTATTTTPTNTVTTTATATPTTIAGGKTYTNSQAKFSFQYPSDFAVTQTSALTIQPTLLGTAIVTLENPTGQYETSNYKQYSIFAVDSSTDTSSCYVNQDNSQMTSSTTIHGTTFKDAIVSNGAAGTQTTSTIYRTVKGTTCYEIVSLVGVSSDYTNIDTTKAAAGKTAATTELGQIAATFMFN